MRQQQIFQHSVPVAFKPFQLAPVETLFVKASHYKNTNFSDPCNCALVKAATEQFKAERVLESRLWINIDGDIYKHFHYDEDAFRIDAAKAIDSNFSNEVIRVIILTRI